eukprot:gnl/TRDRNA2_/TRDRNA2_190460_c0_seq1.p1 gnl/TRDRNA2_/TRDRNA2_190460_c0~~gnl/TRDRNA2_/TRDRNA2_190460_c0_seq1.p1  ORF type:complete len:394 (+),score=60.64 gnl/TRDRNA2_/TRDRNA2_190460_c0_seq1:188-1369(+)
MTGVTAAQPTAGSTATGLPKHKSSTQSVPPTVAEGDDKGASPKAPPLDIKWSVVFAPDKRKAPLVDGSMKPLGMRGGQPRTSIGPKKAAALLPPWVADAEDPQNPNCSHVAGVRSPMLRRTGSVGSPADGDMSISGRSFVPFSAQTNLQKGSPAGVQSAATTPVRSSTPVRAATPSSPSRRAPPDASAVEQLTQSTPLARDPPASIDGTGIRPSPEAVAYVKGVKLAVQDAEMNMPRYWTCQAPAPDSESTAAEMSPCSSTTAAGYSASIVPAAPAPAGYSLPTRGVSFSAKIETPQNSLQDELRRRVLTTVRRLDEKRCGPQGPFSPKATMAAAAGAGATAVKVRAKGLKSKKLTLPFGFSDDDPRWAHMASISDVDGYAPSEILIPTYFRQ